MSINTQTINSSESRSANSVCFLDCFSKEYLEDLLCKVKAFAEGFFLGVKYVVLVFSLAALVGAALIVGREVVTTIFNRILLGG